MENTNVDPTNEYIKICRYEFCKERFEATHMLERYCPEKNGVEHFCKNRQKRLDDQKKREEQEKKAKEEESKPPPLMIVPEPIVLPKDPIMDAYQKKAMQRDLTIKFIIARIGAYTSVDVPVKTVEQFGIDFTGNDHRKFLTEQKRYMLVFGQYGAIWIKDDTIRFTTFI